MLSFDRKTVQFPLLSTTPGFLVSTIATCFSFFSSTGFAKGAGASATIVFGGIAEVSVTRAAGSTTAVDAGAAIGALGSGHIRPCRERPWTRIEATLANSGRTVRRMHPTFLELVAALLKIQ
jgi:hypothetical protein